LGAVAFWVALGISLGSCSGVSFIGTGNAGEFARGIPAVMPDIASLPDGVYNGAYTIVLPVGAIAVSRRWEVNATIASGQLVAIDVSHPDSYPDAGMISTMISRVLAAAAGGAPNALDVDAFSGATYSSKAFLKAVEDALKN
jgi:uncharacterized protein with FMN-binding domain